MDVAARLKAVEQENDMLRERIAQLEAALMGDQPPPLELCLTPSEARVFGALMNREMCTKDSIMAACYRDMAADEAEIKIVDVYICKIRKKVKPFSIEIVTAWGQGYAIPVASKKIVNEMMAAQQVAA